MILIEPMKYALELTKMFNGLSEEQLAFFLKKKYPERDPNKDIDRMHRMKLIKICDNAVCIPNMAINPDIQEAVEIACHLWNKNVISICSEQHPILLKLVKQLRGKVQTFLICKAEDVLDLRGGKENTTIIVVSDDYYKQKTENILNGMRNVLNCSFLIAVKEYGKYYFNKIGGKQ